MKHLQFPEDFKKENHKICPGAFQWRPNDTEYPTFISIIGGGFGQYGDGETTFEMMIDGTVYGWLSIDDVNSKLKKIRVKANPKQ